VKPGASETRRQCFGEHDGDDAEAGQAQRDERVVDRATTSLDAMGYSCVSQGRTTVISVQFSEFRPNVCRTPLFVYALPTARQILVTR
jgi:hypothetical protein